MSFFSKKRKGYFDRVAEKIAAEQARKDAEAEEAKEQDGKSETNDTSDTKDGSKTEASEGNENGKDANGKSEEGGNTDAQDDKSEAKEDADADTKDGEPGHKSEGDPKGKTKDDGKDSEPEEPSGKSELEAVKKLLDADESALEELLPYFEKYLSKHHAYRAVIAAAPPRRKLEVRYLDRLNPGSSALLKEKEVEAIVKKNYDKADREEARRLRFKDVLCYEDGTPASAEDAEVWQARTSSPGENPGDSSKGGDPAA